MDKGGVFDKEDDINITAHSFWYALFEQLQDFDLSTIEKFKATALCSKLVGLKIVGE